MNRFEEIHYLRWARHQTSAPSPEIALIFSGMSAPDAHLFGEFRTEALLDFRVEDHPPLAQRLAAEWDLDPRQVLVQPGSHWNILVAIASRLRALPGCVIVEDPAYEPLFRIPEAMGVEVRRWKRSTRPGFGFDPSALPELIAARPSLVVLTQPHNPSGAILTAEDRRLLAELQAATGCAILSDEVYVEFLEDPADNTLLHACADTTIIRSFTKVFGCGAVRCSALAGASDWIDRAAAFTDHGAVMMSAPSATVADRVWDVRAELWARARAAANAGRVEVEAFVNRCSDLLECHVPRHGIICFPRLREDTHRAAIAMARDRGARAPAGYGFDPAEDGSQVWIEDLRARCDVQVTPGAFFGDSRAFRLGFGIDAGLVREGLRRIEDYLREGMEQA